MSTLSTKDPDEDVVVTFDFSNLSASAPTSPAVTASVHAGPADAAPSAILSGSPQVSGDTVLQLVTGGSHGTDYMLRCEADCGNEHFVIAAVLQVRTAQPS